jgi:poly-beta-1,6-N-acetyl-D-glucosamine synthase
LISEKILKYVVITPAKDEEAYIRFTLESVISQTLLPAEWIIVDDGSTDETPAIIAEYAARYDWIKPCSTRENQEVRSGGTKVVNAFNKGFAALSVTDYDFIVKLDADLTLPPNYFERVAEMFRLHPRLGLCGGYCVIDHRNKLVREKSATYHVRGAFKSYRKACFNDIGGLRPIWNWDGVDEMDAMQKKWEVLTFDLAVLHHRPTSKAYNSFRHAYRSGEEHFRMRSNFFLTLIRTGVRFGQKPYMLGSLYFLAGYLRAFIRQDDEIIEPELSMFTNRFHLNRFYKGIGLK